jgi:DNA polymerase I-like protein with 3'-5' exonuclease and polymerase domains
MTIAIARPLRVPRKMGRDWPLMVDFAQIEIRLLTELGRRLCLPLLAKYAKDEDMKTVSPGRIFAAGVNAAYAAHQY